MPRRTETTPPSHGQDSAPTTIEKSVVAFAEQLGRFVGTVQGKAEGWMNRESLGAQISAVRESAGQLLEQMSGGAGESSDTEKPAPKASAKASRGAVDAPGKKHRGPLPADPRAKNRSVQMRGSKAATTAATKRRGRG